ncbi:hypothetical protein BCR34DRAFT_187346 [Clohesyomyces aquaticus]|uniref:Uncharacterized protein n=1 Tax=Clohesyomyces aquaticus TaxID=1231657 RepID=A0A1Y1YE55_9PLEO|nr:hypothetical protein BCR34DRAFT_187346 [Clohesyomyces aquaticus]
MVNSRRIESSPCWSQRLTVEPGNQSKGAAPAMESVSGGQKICIKGWPLKDTHSRKCERTAKPCGPILRATTDICRISPPFLLRLVHASCVNYIMCAITPCEHLDAVFPTLGDPGIPVRQICTSATFSLAPATLCNIRAFGCLESFIPPDPQILSSRQKHSRCRHGGGHRLARDRLPKTQVRESRPDWRHDREEKSISRSEVSKSGRRRGQKGLDMPTCSPSQSMQHTSPRSILRTRPSRSGVNNPPARQVIRAISLSFCTTRGESRASRRRIL